jgi:hypothetical protein
MDMTTGEAGYMISGGLAGGSGVVSTKNETLKDQVDTMIGIADGLISKPKGWPSDILGPVSLIYQKACYNWIKQLPGGSEHPPVPELNEFIKRAKWAARVAKVISVHPRYKLVKESIGLYLLYESLLWLATSTFGELY